MARTYFKQAAVATTSSISDVDPVNHPPVVPPYLSGLIHENTPTVIDVLRSAHDEDGDVLTITSVTADDAGISLSITSDQKILFVYTGPDLLPTFWYDDLCPRTPDFQFHYTVSDGTTTSVSLCHAGVIPEYNTDQLIVGEKYDERLAGTATSQVMYGGRGQDILVGRAGDDYLFGGYNDDILIGGRGADSFALTREWGHDVIRDFSQREGDIIDLGELIIPGAPSMRGLADIHDFAGVKRNAVDIGDDVLIILNQNRSLRIEGMNIDDLKRSDFLFAYERPESLEDLYA